jgi:hypothetical protein
MGAKDHWLEPSQPRQHRLEWTQFAAQLDGDGFRIFQQELTKYHRRRLEPSLPTANWPDELAMDCSVLQSEGEFVEAVRARIKPLASEIPSEVKPFMAWFERLREKGPGQGDPLFPWLETTASLPPMKWFIEQEVAGEAGFDDLLALTQVKMPQQAKLEMARNYWDEMGRGAAKGMHGPTGASPRCAPHARERGSRGARLGQHDDRPRAQPLLCLSLCRCAWRHRDDGTNARRLCRARLATPRNFRESAALLRAACRPRREAFRKLEPRNCSFASFAGSAPRTSDR